MRLHRSALVHAAAWGASFLLSLATVAGDGPARAVRDIRAKGAEPPAAPEAWLAQVEQQIEASEYHFSLQEDGAWTAPNRAHDLRTSVTAAGVMVTSRRHGSELSNGGWSLSLTLTAWGRDGEMRSLESAAPDAHDNRVEIVRGELAEWFVNTPAGLEQGFTVDSRPQSTVDAGELVLEMRLGGSLAAFVSDDGRSVLFKTGESDPVLRYSGLVVTDATGLAIGARLVVRPGIVQIRIADRDAVYPLEVDPLLTSPGWTTEGNSANANYGTSCNTAGDVNGDGFSDTLVGAELFDDLTDEGKVFLYYGSASGPSTVPSWTAEGDQANAHFGRVAGTAGDVNGDGYDDVLIGAQLYDNGETDEGSVFLWLGSAAGLGANGTPGNAYWRAESNQVGAQMFHPVRAGDVNGDGYGDVLVGAYRYSNPTVQEGAAFLWHGSASGMGVDGTPVNADWRAEIGGFVAFFGHGVGGAGDVNGDGYADVIVGAHGWSNGQSQEGGAFAWYGGSAGLDEDGTVANADWKAESDQLGAQLGHGVSTAGDVNGDGYADVVVGALRYDNVETDEGRVLVYHGSTSGLSATAAWTGEINDPGALLGGYVSTAGDVNGDGYADVIAGAPNYDNGQGDEGGVFGWLGGPAGLNPGAPPSWKIEGDLGLVYLGVGIGTAGDVNGDGYSDVIAGAPAYTNDQAGEGRAWLYYGSGDGTLGFPVFRTGGSGTGFGTSVAAAGDVNGDGYSDVLVGTPLFDNGQVDEGRAALYLGGAGGIDVSASWSVEADQDQAWLGQAVASAGDVNGDGYSDLLVGAPLFDNDQDEEGRIFVYHGGVGLPSTTPDWVAEGDVAGGEFGAAVAGAGDVDGDGDGEVVVGAPFWESEAGQADEGAVFLFEGAPGGLDLGGSRPIGRPTNADWSTQFDQAGAHLGSAVASGGDVNGDGFGEVLVAAKDYTNLGPQDGLAQLYDGSPAGLETMWSFGVIGGVNGGPAIQAGHSIAAADLNGDGYSDVIFGAPGYDIATAGDDHGLVNAWYGSAAGVDFGGVRWPPSGTSPGQRFGSLLASAGDVNGDGFSDVAVGGVSDVTLWTGAASGPSETTPAHTLASGQAVASLAGAGDVDGDGFGDVLVGAPALDSVSVFQGGGGGLGGLERVPRQVRGDGNGPLHLLARSTDESVRLRLLGRTPAGRESVRLEYEIKPLGTPFSQADVQETASVDTGAPSVGSVYDGFDQLVSGLAPGSYKWRRRLASADPLFPRSPWLTLAGNGLDETDLHSCTLVTWYADGDGDGFGNSGVTQITCDEPAGYVPNATDCDDANPARFPGNPEVCDGLDNDCNTLADDLPAPVGNPTLMLARSGGTADLTWTPVAGADRYDVVRGALQALLAGDGDFTDSTESCLENDSVATSRQDSAPPPAGDAFWYLVRPVNCTEQGSYESGAPSQVDERDAEIVESGVGCP